MGTTLYIPTYPSAGKGGIKPAFRQNIGGGGEGGVALGNFFNTPWNSGLAITGSSAMNWTDDHFKDSGGFSGPRTAEIGYGGPTYSIHVSFWVRWNRQPEPNYQRTVFNISRHNSSDPYLGVETWRTDSTGTGRISVKWPAYDPYLNPAGASWYRTSLPQLFTTDKGELVTDKWFWIYMQGGSTPSMMCLTEDDTTDGDTVTNTTPDQGGGNRIADNDNPSAWRAEVSTEVFSATTTSIPTPIDFCNLRVGYGWDVGSTFWANQYWKKQIDTAAERAAYVTAGGTEANSKKQYSYGWPFQTDLKAQGGFGTDFIAYSGSLVSGTGPKLIG